MPKNITTVNPDGTADYATIQAWDADRAGDLVASGFIEEVHMTSSPGGPKRDITQAILGAGWVTDPDNYISMVQIEPHSGVYNTEVFTLHQETFSTGARIVTEFGNNADHVHVSGVQFFTEGRGAQIGKVTNNSPALSGWMKVENCVFHNETAPVDIRTSIAGIQTRFGNTRLMIWNNVFDGFKDRTDSGFDPSAIWLEGNDKTAWIYNNTFFDCNLAVYNHIASPSNVNLRLKNNIVQVCASGLDTMVNVHADSTNNVWDSGVPPGDNPRQATVTFMNTAGFDYHLSPFDVGAFQQGRNLLTDEILHGPYQDTLAPITSHIFDASGNPRTNPWDAGYNEISNLGGDLFKNISTVNPDGGADYASLNVWESDRQGDISITGRNWTERVEVSSSGSADTVDTIMDGWLTDTNNPIQLFQHQSHSGVFNDSIYRIEEPDSSTTTSLDLELTGGAEHVHISGVQFHSLGNAEGIIKYSSNPAVGASGWLKIENCIFHCETPAGDSAGLQTALFFEFHLRCNAFIWNNVFDGYKDRGPGGNAVSAMYLDTEQAPFWIWNNTFFDCDNVFYDENATPRMAFMRIMNNIYQSCATGVVAPVPSIHADSTNNVADLFTPRGSNPRLATVIFRDEFAAAPNLHLDPSDTGALQQGSYLLSNSDLRDGPYQDGKALISTYVLDASGNRRTGPWDVGYNEISNPGVNISVVDPGGLGDYADIATWESDNQRDLVAHNWIEQVNLTSSDGTLDGSRCALAGWTTDTDHYIRIFQIQPHGGIYDENIYKLREPGSRASATIETPTGGADHIHVSGVQILKEGKGAAIRIANNATADASGWFKVQDCLIIGNTQPVNSGPNSAGIQHRPLNIELYAWNNVIFGILDPGGGFDTAAIWLDNSDEDIWLYNNTIYNCTNGIYNQLASPSQTGLRMKNNIIQACATGFVVGSVHADSTHNVWDSGTPPGANPRHATVTFIQPTGVDPDLHLDPSDTGALGQGIDLTSDVDFTTAAYGDNKASIFDHIYDIDYDLRLAPWSMGFDWRFVDISPLLLYGRLILDPLARLKMGNSGLLRGRLKIGKESG